MAEKSTISGIVLYAKKRGPTSFNSLSQIKKALQTKKVGHTGTLDSFAEGLLVVMVGSLTRLASHVTAFDKTYEAIIQFGSQTDTLDPYGQVVETAELPLIEDFKKSLNKHTGTIEQFPPLYSAIHIGGKRASDIARSGKTIDIPSRTVTVYNSKILNIQEKSGRVEYAHVSFHVSKGTYIRSLARDIAIDCSSCAHLIALKRTMVGSFSLDDAVGLETMDAFTIANAICTLGKIEIEQKRTIESDKSQEIIQNLKQMTKDLAVECGMSIAVLKNEYEFHFYNGKPLKKAMFAFDVLLETNYAIFDENNVFIGVVQIQNGRLSYGYVIPIK